MATEDQVLAGRYLAANTSYYVKRITKKAVILHCSDPNVRIRVDARNIWRQKRLISRTGTQWLNSAELKMDTRKMAAAARAANERLAQRAQRLATGEHA